MHPAARRLAVLHTLRAGSVRATAPSQLLWLEKHTPRAMASITSYFKPTTAPVSGAKRPRSDADTPAEGRPSPKPAAAALEEARAIRVVEIAGDPLLAAQTAAPERVVPPTEEPDVLKTFGIEAHSSWVDVMQGEAKQAYFKRLMAYVTSARASKTIFPPPHLVFSTFQLTPFDAIKVVILGQDPYHGPGQAHGLAFSVQRGVAFPPSLRNILKEAQDDVNIAKPTHGCLEHWARQGVLLLNAVLTVESGKANSHAEAGWEQFTSAIVKAVSDRRSGVVFMLWGKSAQVKGSHIDRKRHLVLEAPHPSPLSAHTGFLGCRHFSKANEYLVSKGVTPIDWNLGP